MFFSYSTKFVNCILIVALFSSAIGQTVLSVSVNDRIYRPIRIFIPVCDLYANIPAAEKVLYANIIFKSMAKCIQTAIQMFTHSRIVISSSAPNTVSLATKRHNIKSKRRENCSNYILSLFAIPFTFFSLSSILFLLDLYFSQNSTGLHDLSPIRSLFPLFFSISLFNLNIFLYPIFVCLFD